MNVRILLVSVPFADIEQTEQEKEYWKWHYAIKTKLTYRNLNDDLVTKIGNIENQNVGLLSIASYLTNNGVEVKYIAPSTLYSCQNRENKFLDQILSQIENYNPSFIGFSAITYNMPIAFYYAQKVKEKKPFIKTVIGGAHANGASGETLNELMNSFDFVIRGKGEIPFLNLINGNIDSIGICCRSNGKDIINPTCMLSINNYPDPMYHFLEVDELPAARVYSSLGCRSKSQCIFCGDILHNKDFVVKDVKNVINEIKSLYHDFSTKHFYFGDENFFFDKQRAIYAMDEINNSGLNITVGYQVRIEDTDEELIKKASEYGKCTEIHVGVESFSQEVLNLNNKGLRIDNVKKFCELTKKYGISNHCYFLTGLPGETEETSYLTIKRMEELLNAGLIDMVEYRIAIPFPGTPIEKYSEKYGVKIKHKMWEFYKGERLPPFDLESITSERIYELYLEGLETITNAYIKKYSKEYNDEFIDLKTLGSVIGGGF